MRERVNGFSYMRAIACIAVVCLHTVYVAVRIFENQITQSQWIASKVAVNCFMWAVPCFVMVSGALLLQPERNITYKKIFGSYIRRMAEALLLFCMVFRVVDIIMNKEGWSAAGVLQGITKLLTATSWSHLWYLYLMIGIYLLLPFYRMIAAKSSQKDLWYLIGVYFLFLSVIPLVKMTGYESGFYIHVSTIYPLYLFLGYTLYHTEKEVLRNKWLAAGVFLIATAAIIALSIMKYRYGMLETEELWGYSSPLVVLQAMGAYGYIVMGVHKLPAFCSRLLVEIDRCSFGIYLIHMIFVRILIRYMQVNPYRNMTILYFVLLVVGITLVSHIITAVLKKVPVIQRIL